MLPATRPAAAAGLPSSTEATVTPGTAGVLSGHASKRICGVWVGWLAWVGRGVSGERRAGVQGRRHGDESVAGEHGSGVQGAGRAWGGGGACSCHSLPAPLGLGTMTVRQPLLVTFLPPTTMSTHLVGVEALGL